MVRMLDLDSSTTTGAENSAIMVVVDGGVIDIVAVAPAAGAGNHVSDIDESHLHSPTTQRGRGEERARVGVGVGVRVGVGVSGEVHEGGSVFHSLHGNSITDVVVVAVAVAAAVAAVEIVAAVASTPVVSPSGAVADVAGVVAAVRVVVVTGQTASAAVGALTWLLLQRRQKRAARIECSFVCDEQRGTEEVEVSLALHPGQYSFQFLNHQHQYISTIKQSIVEKQRQPRFHLVGN